jgi:hypothetical protein
MLKGLKLLAISLMLVACSEVVELKIDGETEKIVLNSILDASNDTIFAQLTWSNAINKPFEVTEIDKGDVFLRKGSEILGKFHYVSDGYYMFLHKPEVGKTYTIIAVVDGDTVQGATTIPPKTVFSVSYTDSVCRFFTLDFNTNVFNDYVYWLTVLDLTKDYLGIAEESHISFNANHVLIDNFNGILGASKCHLIYDYSTYIRFNNTNSQVSESIELSISKYTSNMSLEFNLFSVDVNYDRFLKSYIKYCQNSGDPAIFLLDNIPVMIYSNIDGGIGVVGAINPSITQINFKNGEPVK